MRCRSFSPTARGLRRVVPSLGALGLLLTAGLAWTAFVADQVTLQARHRAGVPLHQEPQGGAPATSFSSDTLGGRASWPSGAADPSLASRSDAPARG
jgi:hypothetical protein